MSNQLHLHLFGTPQFTYQGKPLTGFVSNKVRALLIYLAVTGRAHSREALAELLWADTPQTARINLRKALSNLRRLDGVNILEPTTDTVALDREHCWIDVAEFERDCASESTAVEQLAQTAQLYQADFLAGFNFSLSYEFEAWGLAEQARLKRAMIDLLDRLAAAYEATNDYQRAIATARRQLTIEPWRETAHRRLMALLARTGDRSGALAQFQRCVDALWDELAVEPAPETTDLYNAIQTGRLVPTDANVGKRGNKGTRDPSATNVQLPHFATALVGREQAIGAINSLLLRTPSRLVTLTGPGGVGKTRLAIACAERQQDHFTDGVFFASLVAVQRAEDVMGAIVAAIPAIHQGTQPAEERLRSFFAEKQALLLLDNVEHVVAAAPQIGWLLEQCSTLHILATGRRTFNIYGEQTVPVGPLRLPMPEEPLATQQTAPALQLFQQRLQLVEPRFTLSDSAVPTITAICLALDGLPLALELGAAQFRFMSLSALLQQLEHHAGLRWNGASNHDQRHHTLTDTIDWSYQLLEPATQECFRRLGVFVGGFTLQAAQAIYGDAEPHQVGGQLNTLVAHNLIQQSTTADGSTRYSMLETVRHFSAEQLRASDACYTVHRDHAAYFLAMAEQAEDKIWHLGVHVACEQLRKEEGNLRTALQWAIDVAEHQLAFRIGGALGTYWITSFTLVEGKNRLDYLLKLPEIADYPQLHGKILRCSGRLADFLGDYQRSKSLLTEALAITRATKDHYAIAICLSYLGITVRVMGKYEEAKQIHTESHDLFQGLDDAYGIAVALKDIGICYYLQQQYAKAEQYYIQADHFASTLDDPFLKGYLLGKIGDAIVAQGRYQEGQLLLRRSIAIHQTLNAPTYEAYLLIVLGKALQADGNYLEAMHCFRRSLELNEQFDYFWGRVIGLAAYALAVAQVGHYQKAWQLTSFVVHMLEQANIKQLNYHQDLLEMAYDTIRPALNESDAAAYWQLGKHMSMSDVIEYAITDTVGT